MVSKKQKNKEIGDLGEQIACNYLENKGFVVIERNYWKKWGEIDIVARETTISDKTPDLLPKPVVSREIIHFVEVKSVSYETKHDLEHAVTHETWRPEEQVHHFKLHQIHKALESWIVEHDYEGEFMIDVIGVRVVPRETYATVKFIENVIE